MKLRYDFEITELGNDIMAVPVGEGAGAFHGVLRINESAKTILNMLKKDVDEEEIVSSLAKQYAGDDASIRNAVHGFLDKLKKEDLLAL